jgi:hypothetical protein
MRLAWVWSQSNVFVNQTGRAHMRGAWPGLENEMRVRRRVGGDSPADMCVAANGLGRELHLDMPPSHFSTAFGRIAKSLSLQSPEERPVNFSDGIAEQRHRSTAVGP